MKKIIMFNTIATEKPFVKPLEKANHVQIKTTSDSLNLKTIHEVKGFDGVMTQTVDNDPKFFAQLHQMGIKQVALRHTGFENVNVKAARANHIILTNVPAYSPRSVSEMVLAQVMMLVRHLRLVMKHAKKGNFLWTPDVEAREIHNLTVGVIGTGVVGSTVARIFKALGCKVLANDLKPDTRLEATVQYVDKKTLLKESDIVTMHTPLDASTHHLIGAPQFKIMKDSAIFINASRGGVVDTPALIKALDNHEIASAGLDTIEDEGPVFNKDTRGAKIPNKFIRNLMVRPNVIITPHIAYYTDNSIQNMAKIALRNTLQVLAGKRPDAQVD